MDAKVKMTRAAMVALLVGCGWPKADKWEDGALMDRVVNLPDKIERKDVPAELQAQYDALAADGAELELISGELGAPKTGNGKASPAKPASDKGNSEKGATKGKSGATAAKPASKKEPGAPRGGKLGGYNGHSITSVIRAFGKAGWKSAEAKAFFEDQKIPVSPTTVSIQLRHGREGSGGEPAGLTQKELKEIKPVVEEKPKAEKPPKAEKVAAKKK